MKVFETYIYISQFFVSLAKYQPTLRVLSFGEKNEYVCECVFI